jgi:DNA replication protein DnaC
MSKPGNSPCACGCGCTRPSTQPRTDSVVLEQRARCLSCSRPDHRALHPSDVSTPLTRPLTPQKELPPALRRLDAEIASRQKAEIYEQSRARWLASLPEKFRESRADHPKIVERLQRLEAGEPGTAGALVFGPVGEGKTFLALGYANMAIEAGYVQPGEVLFGTESELLASAANSSFGEVESALRRLTSPSHRMLIIDDVGRGTWLRDDMRPKVFMLVLDAAWRNNRIVVVTTNLGVKDLEEYIGIGAMDRLRSMCGYTAISLEDRKMRRQVTEASLASTERKLAKRTTPETGRDQP